MGIHWDQHLLAPLHSVFGDPVEYRPTRGTPYTVSGIFDRAYTQDVEPLDDGSTINTTKPILGVRDSEFRSLPKQGDRVFIAVAGGVTINTLFTVSDVQPDSHGGSKLILNQVKKYEYHPGKRTGGGGSTGEYRRRSPCLFSA